MRLTKPGVFAALAAAFVFQGAQAATVLKLDLEAMASRADLVFRGSVLSAEPGSRQIGGAELPTMTYELLVDEQFKGQFDSGKDRAVVSVTMIGSPKSGSATAAGLQRFSALPNLPDLRVGQEYLLFTTPPSAAGLSTTVGLGQGAFKIYLSDDRQELAANELNNSGLFNGPVAYATLAGAIRAALGN